MMEVKLTDTNRYCSLALISLKGYRHHQRKSSGIIFLPHGTDQGGDSGWSAAPGRNKRAPGNLSSPLEGPHYHPEKKHLLLPCKTSQPATPLRTSIHA